MSFYEKFPEPEVQNADYTSAADAAGIRPGEPASASDDTLGENGKKWSSMLNEIFTTVTQCRVVNECDVISDFPDPWNDLKNRCTSRRSKK